MNKLIALVSLALLCPLASANSPIVGPYIQRTIGKLGQAPWGQCRIYPNGVVLQTSKRTSPVAIQHMDSRLMSDKIKEASEGELRITALHFMPSIPEVHVTAGVFMSQSPVADFMLYRDASTIQTRTGQASAELLQLVDKYCVNLIAE